MIKTRFCYVYLMLSGVFQHYFVILLECNPKPADIVFLLDASGSIGNLSFERQLDFVSQYVNIFPIGTNDVQIGIVIYSDLPHLEFNLNNYTDSTSLQSAIQNIPYIRGTTNTAGAIEYVVNNSFTTSAGNRDDAIDVLITITDGESNNKTETIRVAQSIGVHSIRSYAIGVGNFTNSAELQAIASDPQHVFNVQNYAALFTLQRELSRAACIGMIFLFQL